MGVSVGTGYREAVRQTPRGTRLHRVVVGLAERRHDIDGGRRPEAAGQSRLVERQTGIAAADLAEVDVLAARDIALAVADVPNLNRERVRQHLLHRRVERRDDSPGVGTNLVRGDRRARGHLDDRLRQVENRELWIAGAEAADGGEVVRALLVDLHVDREIAHARADHVVVLRIPREAGAEYERIGRAVRNAYAGREQILLDRDVAINRDAAQTAQFQAIECEVEHFHPTVGVLWDRVVLPSHASRHGDLARQLELVADVDAVFPRPECG